MRPIRVLRITSNLNKGGAGAHVLALQRALAAFNDIDSTHWCPREKSENPPSLNDRLPKAVLYFNFLRTRLCGLDSLYAPLWNRRLAALLPQYDIVHLHHLQGYFFDIRSLEYLRDKPTVLTLHDMWPLTGRCSVTLGCEKWRTRCGRCPHKQVYPATCIDLSRFLFEKKARAFGALQRFKVVAISQYGAELARAGHLRHAEIQVIPPAVDGEQFKPLPRSNSGVTVGVAAARLDFPGKGFELLLRLIAFNEKNRCGLRFRIVGRLSEASRRALSPFRQVELFPFTNEPKEMCRHYNAMDVFFNPSHNETFGKTNIEAQACGTPVVARDIPPFRENVRFGGFFREDDPDGLIGEIMNTAAASWDRRSMHEAICAEFGLPILGARYAALYRSFFDGQNP